MGESDNNYTDTFICFINLKDFPCSKYNLLKYITHTHTHIGKRQIPFGFPHSLYAHIYSKNTINLQRTHHL